MLRYLQRETVGCGRRLLSKGSSAMSAYKKFALALTTSALVFAPSVAWAQESTTPVAAAPVPVVTTQDVQENDENDPLEGGNRVMFEINQVLDEVLLRPVAVVYKNVLPDFAQDGVRNFMNNLNSPVIFANDLLQGETDRAGVTLLRFGINSTIGVGGSVTFFKDRDSALAANALAHSWISQSLLDMFDGEPEIVVGDILYSGGIIPRTHPATEP
jgi:hypothetical protein